MGRLRGRTETEVEYTRNKSEGQELRSPVPSEARGDVLARIIETKRAEVRALAGALSELRARAREMPAARGFAAALRRPGEVALLAEIKRRSPSAGVIREDADPARVAEWYRAGGASALSVLTDEQYFGGSLDALRAARAAVELPILRKDFIIDPVQIWEARTAGADAVLLIVRALTPTELRMLLGEAAAAGLDVLVEVHDAEELETALSAGSTLVGVNNRDLRTFTTDLSITHSLADHVPPEVTLVAESGIRTASDIVSLGETGVDAVLVGESLMRQPDVKKAAGELVGHPKRERR